MQLVNFCILTSIVSIQRQWFVFPVTTFDWRYNFEAKGSSKIKNDVNMASKNMILIWPRWDSYMQLAKSFNYLSANTDSLQERMRSRTTFGKSASPSTKFWVPNKQRKSEVDTRVASHQKNYWIDLSGKFEKVTSYYFHSYWWHIYLAFKQSINIHEL